MRVAVLGSGNGGVATAWDFAHAGHDVALYDLPEFDAVIPAIAQAGGIHAEGDLEGFAPVRYAGHDIAEAMDGADLVIVVGPAYGTEAMARAVADHLRPGVAVLVCPASCAGALTFAQAAGLPVDGGDVILGETSTLPYAVRIVAPGTVHVYLKLTDGVYLAGLPRSSRDRLMELVSGVWPAIRPADSVFQTTLQNGNPVIHPAVTLLNAGIIDRTGGDLLFYEEGVTPAVGRLIEAVDGERLAIAAALGVQVLSEPALGVRQGYMTEENYSTGYSTAPGFLGIKAQASLDNRYLTEDVGYSLVFLSDLGDRLGVPTPHMDAIITIASTILGRDFRAEAPRTLETLGLGERDADGLVAL